MHLLLPADPFDRAKPDEAYAAEAQEFLAAGYGFSLFSFEEFEAGAFKVRPAMPEGVEVVYRGWMLTPNDYARLAAAVEQHGARLRTTVEQYRLCHHLPGWYSLCPELTPRTAFAAAEADFGPLLAGLGPPPYFIKDYVKSLTTERGSVARDAGEVTEIVALIKQFRGQVEGGICIREFVEIDTATEERFFVINGKPKSMTGVCPSIVAEVATRIASPFYSVDVASRLDGTSIIIELGDGQVSDRKAWPVERFVDALGAA